MKVTPGEELVSEHFLLLINMMFKKKVRRKVKLRNKLKLWRLRESEMKEDFSVGVNKCDGNEDLCSLKRKLLDAVRHVCDYTKIKPKNLEK